MEIKLLNGIYQKYWKLLKTLRNITFLFHQVSCTRKLNKTTKAEYTITKRNIELTYFEILII